jgi:hypothetical protein
LYTTFVILAILGSVLGQNCSNMGADFVDNAFAYGTAKYVVDVWNPSAAFILPFPPDDASGDPMCHVLDILGSTSVKYECLNDTHIKKTSYTQTGCMDALQTESYIWETGYTPELDPTKLPLLISSPGSGFRLDVAAGSGNLYDFSCQGSYQAVSIKMALTPDCSGAVTVYGGIGAPCLGTNMGYSNLLVSCDCDGAYLTTFYAANASTSFTEDNVCENNGVSNFVCDAYNATATCGELLFSTTANAYLYGQKISCTACTTTTASGDGSSAIMQSFSILFVALSVFTVLFQ